MSTDSLGVIVIGAGDMGARHAAHWRRAGATVVAICDPDVARAAQIAQTIGVTQSGGVQAVADYRELLGNAHIQVASVCTPTHLHQLATVDCLDAGLHVLCEKPIALTLGAGQRMLEAAQQNKRELRIGFMRRFEPIFHELQRIMNAQSGVVKGSVRISAGIRPKRLMHDKNANGGPIIDMCCHIFDVWKVLFKGKPQLLSASGTTYANAHPALAGIEEKAIDSAVATFGFPNGHRIQLLVTWGLPEGVPFSEKHSYISKDGLIEVDWNYQTNTVSLHDGVGLSVYQGERDPWQAEIQQFHKELTQDAPRLVADAQDGMDALELSLAMLEAIALEATALKATNLAADEVDA